jgi:Uma2 family endonuclease
MNAAVFTPKRTRITTDQFHKMVEAGVLTKQNRIELIEGELLEMAPIGAQHAALTSRLTRLFNLALGDAAVVSPGGPVDLGGFSTPQPDVMLLRYRADFYAEGIPKAADVLLAVEISDSTLNFDQTDKQNLYSRYSVPEYWVVDVAAKRLIIYSEPTRSEGYARELRFTILDSVVPKAFPQLKLAVKDIFGVDP